MVAVFTYVYYTHQPKDLHPQRIMKIDLHSFFMRINQRNYITNNLEKKNNNQRKLQSTKVGPSGFKCFHSILVQWSGERLDERQGPPYTACGVTDLLGEW